MRARVIVVLLLFTVALCSMSLEERLHTYAGTNASGLTRLLYSQSGDTLRYVRFLLGNASDVDLAALDADFVMQNVRLAARARQLPWAQRVPEDVFLHFVLPARVSQEPYQAWREPFYDELTAELDGVTDIYEAIALVNIWCAGQMRFEPTNGRDQAPLTTIRRGYGRCEEMMILFIAAARSVGIPARTASAPFWSFTDNNHAWTEVWTPDGWTFLGAAEPANRLAEAWFTRSTQRAPLVVSHAIGDYPGQRTLEMEDGVSTLVTTDIYAPTHMHRFTVLDAKGAPVPQAEVVLYAVTYGGLFPMLSVKTDAAGQVSIPLGQADVLWSAQQGERFAMGYVDGSQPGEHELFIVPGYTFDDTWMVHFLSTDETTLPESEEAILSDFDLRKQVAELTRDRRLRDERRTRDFLRHYALTPQDGETAEDFTARRDEWLAQCERMAGAAADWLSVLEAAQDDPAQTDVLRLMLADWDIKELVELPDSAAIHQRAASLAQARTWWAVPDSIWRAHVLNLPFPRVPCPESGWAQAFHQRVQPLRGGDIAATVLAVQGWLEAETVLDTTVHYTYFTGSLDPLQWLNLRHMGESGRSVLTGYALNSLGVPLRWRGYLEYWNNDEWHALEQNTEEPVEREEHSLVVRMELDGKPIAPKPWENFLLASLSEDGLYYTWFEADTDSLRATLHWTQQKDTRIVLQAAVRHDNGDAAVRLLSIPPGTDSLTIRLPQPTRRGEEAAPRMDDMALAARDLGGEPQGAKLVYVLGRASTEPQQRMVQQLRELIPALTDAGVDVVVWVEGRRQVSVDGARVMYGRPVGGEEQSAESYPFVYLFDNDGNLLYTSRGYNLSVPGQIRQKIL